MTCELKYIKDLNLPTIQTDELTKLHFDTIDELFRNKELFLVRANKLIPAPSKKAKLESLIANWNTNKGKGVQILSIVKEGDKEYIKIDVRPYADNTKIYASPTPETSDFGYYDSLHKGLKDVEEEFYKPLNIDLSSFEHREWFVNKLEDLKKRFATYSQLVNDKQIQFPNQEVKRKEFEDIRKMLNNPDLMKRIEGFSEFVTTSVQWLDSINKDTISNETQQMLQDIKTLPEGKEKRDLLQQIAKQLNRDKYFLGLFDELQAFKDDLVLKGLLKPDTFYYKFDTLKEDLEKEFEDFYSKQLEIDAQKFIDDLESKNDTTLQVEIDKRKQRLAVLKGQTNLQTIDDIVNFANSKEFSEVEFIKMLSNSISVKDETVSGKYKTRIELIELEKKISNFLDKRRAKSFNALFSDSLSTVAKLKYNLKNQHEQITVDWLYPIVKEKMSSLPPEKQMSEDMFRNYIKLANADENFFASWMEATISSKDPVVAAVAAALKELLVENHIENLGLTHELQAVRGRLGIDGKNSTKADRDRFHKQFTREILVLKKTSTGRPILITPDNEKQYELSPKIEIDTPFGRRSYLAESKTAFKKGLNTSWYKSKKDILADGINYGQGFWENGAWVKTENDWLEHYIDKVILVDPEKDATKKLNSNSKFFEAKHLLAFRANLLTSSNSIDRVLGKAISNKKGTGLSTKFSKGITRQGLKAVIKNQLYKDFFDTNNQQLTDAEIQDVFDKHGLKQDFLNHKLTAKLKDFLFKNGKKYTRQVIDDNRKSVWDRLEQDGFINDSVIQSNGKILVQVDGELQFLPAYEVPQDANIFYYAGKLSGINKALFSFNDNYKSTDADYQKYFDTLIDNYDKSNVKLDYQKLDHYIIPQIEANDGISLDKDLPKTVYEKVVNFLSNLISNNWFKKAKDFKIESEENREFTSPDYYYLSGDKVRTVKAKFVDFIDDDKVEKDLFNSLIGFATAANSFKMKNDVEPQVQVIKSLILGDSILNIQARKTIDRDIFGNVNEDKNNKGLPLQKTATNLNNKLDEFLNDFIYDDTLFNSSFTALGFKIDASKVANKLSSVTAFASLAGSWMNMANNMLIGNISNWQKSVTNKYTTQDNLKSAHYEYGKWMLNGMMKDAIENDTTKHSLLTKLLYYFDGIQGEFYDPTGKKLQKGQTVGEFVKNVLFFTQNGAEHQIQSVNMIAMMKTYKVGNKSLWDIVNENEDKEDFGLTDKVVKDFTFKLHATNKEIHGNYNSFDKSRIQRRWYGQFILMFRKYLYTTYKTKFGSKQFDYELGDETQGYVNLYFQRFISDLHNNKSVLQLSLQMAMKLLAMPFIGTTNIATSRFGLNLFEQDKIQKYLIGDNVTVEEINAAKRMGAEMGMYLILTMLALIIASAEDDDDDNLVLKNLEVLIKKTKGDIGQFMPYYGAGYGAFNTLDFVQNLAKNPFPQMRLYKLYGDFLYQLLGWEYKEGEINFNFNDQYDRGGAGYEKGDYKLQKKTEKIISPYYQFLKLLTPDEQLKYLDMVRKNN